MIRPGLSSRKQHGSTLVIAMILLLVMSVLAASSLRSTTLQERMSSNAYDRDLAFQAAEAGLRMGERIAENWAKTSGTPAITQACPTSDATTGRYVNMAPTDTCAPLWEGPEPGKNGSYWHDAKNDSGQNVISFADAQLSLTPFYIVELISTHAPCDPANPSKSLNCKRFRVTSASRDANGRAKVILQSIYATK